MNFTRYHRPNGRRSIDSIEVPAETETLAAELVAAGWAFEIELLSTQKVHMDCCDSEEQLALKLVDNGAAVPPAVVELVANAHKAWIARGRPFAEGYSSAPVQ